MLGCSSIKPSMEVDEHEEGQGQNLLLSLFT
jgi:hypothetical protein